MFRSRILPLLVLVCMYYVTNAQTVRDSFSIYFDFGKADIKPVYKKTLDSFARKIPEGEVFYINGYADHPGGDSLNLAISKKRAQNVASALVHAGIGEERIINSAGLGSVTKGGTDRNATFRRADIIIDKPRSTWDKLATLQLNDVLELRNILFIAGSHVLKNLKFVNGVPVHDLESYTINVRDTICYQLDTLAIYLVAHPTIKLRLEGHICCFDDSYEKVHGLKDFWDSESRDYKLSEHRAKAVADYLSKKGVDPARLSYVGYGFSKPKRYPENTPEDMELNRRVEMRILEK